MGRKLGLGEVSKGRVGQRSPWLVEGKGKVKTRSQAPAFGLWGLGKGHFQGMKKKDQPGWTERETEMRWGEVTACDFAGPQTKGVGKRVCTGREAEPNAGISQATRTVTKRNRGSKRHSPTHRSDTHRDWPSAL